MTEPTPVPLDPRTLLSALADGEADSDECRLGLAACDDADARARWHAYHLIGDVLRSEDLASRPAHDRAFVEGLRRRLAQEPPVPAVAAAPERRVPVPDAPVAHRRWALPVALAAGIGALGVALVVQRSEEPPARLAVTAAPDRAGTPTVPAGTVLVRDAQLDRYLRAHREYGAAQPVSLPVASRRDLEPEAFGR
jgi:sigma-E factor negative regulatory protein RseA